MQELREGSSRTRGGGQSMPFHPRGTQDRNQPIPLSSLSAPQLPKSCLHLLCPPRSSPPNPKRPPSAHVCSGCWVAPPGGRPRPGRPCPAWRPGRGWSGGRGVAGEEIRLLEKKHERHWRRISEPNEPERGAVSRVCHPVGGRRCHPGRSGGHKGASGGASQEAPGLLTKPGPGQLGERGSSQPAPAAPDSRSSW